MRTNVPRSDAGGVEVAQLVARQRALVGERRLDDVDAAAGGGLAHALLLQAPPVAGHGAAAWSAPAATGSPGPRRGLPVAAGADHAAAADRQPAPPGAGGRERGRAERGVDVVEAALADEGPLTRYSSRPPRRRRRPDRRAGARPHPHARDPARPRRPRPMKGATQAFVLAATGSASRPRWTATRRSPSWPGATSPGTGPRATATSPTGRASRCATPAPGSPRSAAS